MKLNRSTFMVAGLALVAGACGDDVTVTQPAAPTPVVNSVSVAPSSATLTVGQSVNLTAAVNADAGLATTVTWSSSDATRASVSATGTVTAVAATPGVAVCATSTVDTGKKGCATIVVQAATATIPATVSIASITTNAGGLNAPVNINNVAGQIDVKVNVLPGNQNVSKVVLVANGVSVDSQTFTAAQAAQLRFDADQAVANQTTFPQVLFAVNTAFYSTAAGPITPRFANGSQTISVRLFTTQGGATAAATATDAPLVFNNLDGFHVAVSGGTSANDATGYRWTGNGSMIINARPVMYSGRSVGAINTTLANSVSTCASAAPAAANQLASATTATNFTDTLALAAYSYDASLANCGNGVQYPSITATDGNGVVITNLVTGGVLNSPANTASWNADQTLGLRWDNVAPSAPATTAALALNGRANNWINDAVAFNAVFAAATPNNAIVTVSTDNTGGSGLPTAPYFGRAAASTTVATVAASANITSAAGLARSATNATYCLALYAQDRVGNVSANPGTCAAGNTNGITFGVDRDAPTIAYSGGITANQRRNAGTIGAEFTVTVNDTGLVGNSGMLPTSPVRMTLSRRAIGAANSAGTTTLLAGDGTTVVTALSTTGVGAAAPLYSTTITGLTGAANHAYWTHNATAFDAAGNSASVAARTMVYDATAPVVGTPSVPLTVTATGYAATTLVNEDLDIQDYFTTATYAGAPVMVPAVIQTAPNVAVNGFNAATFSNTNFALNTTFGFPLAIQANVAAGLTNHSAYSVSVRSQGNLTTASAGAVPVTITPGTAISTTGYTTFVAAVPVGVTGLTQGTTAATAAVPASTTIRADITGPTATGTQPFSRMDFYMLNAAGTAYVFVGSVANTAMTLNDNGATRVFTYSLSINGATVGTALGGGAFASQLLAVGMNASGNIGMVSAALVPVNFVP